MTRSGTAFALLLLLPGLSVVAGQTVEGAGPSVAVLEATPLRGSVPDLVTAYGSAMPALDGGMALSLQQEGRVQAIAVTPGETVRAGQRLLDFAAAATAVAAWRQAVSGLALARQQRSHTAQLLGQQLATRDQLAQADKAMADAEAALDAMRREGADQPARTLTAPFDGIVAAIAVAQGDRVQPGATLMTLTRLDGLVVTVGIEPGQRPRVHPGEKVRLLPMDGGAPLDGSILRVDFALNPKTRLVDADVAVPVGSVMSGATFRADITVGALNGWIVPHDAVLRDANGAYLFQVAGAVASRVDVTVAGPSGPNDVVEGAIDQRRPIVVQGNYQLSDQTPVRIDRTPPALTDAASGDAPRAVTGDAPRAAGGDTPRAAGGDTPRAAGGDTPRAAGGDAPSAASGDTPRAASGDPPRAAGGDTQ